MELVSWGVVAIFVLLSLFFHQLWRRSVRDAINLTNLVVAILQDDEMLEKQRVALDGFLEKADYSNKAALAGWVSMGISEIAASWGPILMQMNADLLWQLNQEMRQKN